MAKADKEAALKDIDSALARHEEMQKGTDPGAIQNESELITRYVSTISRWAPKHSPYFDQMQRMLARKYDPYDEWNGIWDLQGVLKALRDDCEHDRLRNFEERINTDIFSDFLAMAEYLSMTNDCLTQAGSNSRRGSGTALEKTVPEERGGRFRG